MKHPIMTSVSHNYTTVVAVTNYCTSTVFKTDVIFHSSLCGIQIHGRGMQIMNNIASMQLQCTAAATDSWVL